MNVVLLVMGAGDCLEEHASPGPISLAVREGRIHDVRMRGFATRVVTSTRIATRYEKHAVNYRAAAVSAALMIWLTV